MGRRPLLVMVVGWVAVVAAVGAITFVVVSDAGNGVGRASAAGRVMTVSPKASGSASATPMVTPSPSPTPSMSSTPQRTPTSEPSIEPGATARPRATNRAPRPAAPAADRRTASFTTDGGIVVAFCRGQQIFLKSIRPRDGWRFTPKPSRLVLEVSFTSGSEEDEEGVDIKLSCVDEVPTRATAQSSRSKDTRGPAPETE